MELAAFTDYSRAFTDECTAVSAGDVSQCEDPTTIPTANMTHLGDQSIQWAISWKKLLRWADFLINDILVIMFSFSDIVLDVLVCVAFYRQGRVVYFYASMAIFVVAQLTYSFLFVATWAGHLSPLRQIGVFVSVLPVSQLVPIFTWLESFRFESLDSAITNVGLKPTLVDLSSEEDGGDMLWGYIQHKYKSHAGFLAEALAEAIPQCMLQTVAIITAQEASPLLVVSILSSIVVVASKGYLISYSIHRLTFLFNFVCIVADVFGLFAVLSWLFQSGSPVEDAFSASYVGLLVVGWALLVVGGLSLVLFSMLDDHVKIRHFEHPREELDGDLWYHIYTVRVIAWFIAIIPVCIVFLTTKLTLVPILVFKSLDPEHAQRWQFYSMLYQFLSLFKTDTRVVMANRFFAQCQKDKARLLQELGGYSINRRPNGLPRNREKRAAREREVVREWLAKVGNFGPLELVVATPQDTGTFQQYTVPHETVLQTLNTTEDEALSRARLRRALLQHEIEARMGGTWRELARRSALFRILMYSDHADALGVFTLLDKLIVAFGMGLMLVGLLCMALFIPVFLAFVVYAVLYPLIQLVVQLRGGGLPGTLAVILSSLRIDIIDIKNFPGLFYEKHTIQELHKRFVNDIDKKIVEKYMDAKLGRDMVFEINSFLLEKPEYRDVPLSHVISQA